MKLTLSALAIFSVLGLTGCSSSGGGTEQLNNRELSQPTQTQNTDSTTTTQNTSGTTANTTTTTTASSPTNVTTSSTSTTETTPSVPTTTPSAPATPTTPTTPTMGRGGHVLVTNNTAASDTVVYPLNNGYTDNKIIVEGRVVDLGLPISHEIDEFAYINLSPIEMIGVSKGFNHVRFGYYIDYTQANSQGIIPAYQFVIGNMTADSDIPTSGSARYTGRSLIKPVGHGEDAGWFQGYSQFDVDFGNKSITGYVRSSPGEIPLAGSINGTSFSGKHNGSSMQGNFYGPQAAELGGTFSAPITFKGAVTNATGAFGAAK